LLVSTLKLSLFNVAYGLAIVLGRGGRHQTRSQAKFFLVWRIAYLQVNSAEVTLVLKLIEVFCCRFVNVVLNESVKGEAQQGIVFLENPQGSNNISLEGLLNEVGPNNSNIT
jgi:hypothetical protein